MDPNDRPPEPETALQFCKAHRRYFAWLTVTGLLLVVIVVLLAADDQRVADCFHEMFWAEQRGAGCGGLFAAYPTPTPRI